MEILHKWSDNNSMFASMIQHVKISAKINRTPQYTLGEYVPYHRTVDFPIEIKTNCEIWRSDKTEKIMPSKFQIGDCVKLVHMVYPNLGYEGYEAIVINVKFNQVMYGSFYSYTVSVVDSLGQTDAINDLLESNLELLVKSEPMEVWPPVCSCSNFQLASAGCDCGAMKKEREMRAKGLDVIKGSN